MRRTTDGLVIKEQIIGEKDRLITVLTRDMGVVRAFVRGAKTVKSSLVSATGLLCYSTLSLYVGRDKYIVEDAVPIEVFFSLRDDIIKLSLAQYILQLDQELAPKEDTAEEFLRFTLNALHLLGSGTREPRMIKAVAELRMLSYAGYMPNLIACCECGLYESDPMYFAPVSGVLYCKGCYPSSGCVRLSPGAVTAMRHIVLTDMHKVFSFKVAEQSMGELATVSEQYLLVQTRRNYTTLDFYHTLTV